MTRLVFPALPSGELIDSAKFSESTEDPSMSTEMDGGYMVSRAKFTRAPRKTWTCSYTFIDNADKAVIDAFYRSVMGGSTIFDWLNPQDNQTYSVRFVKDSMRSTYAGKGTNQRWDVLFSLVQV